MSTLTAERPTAEPATRPRAPKRRLRGEAKLHPLVWVFVVAVMGFSLIPFYWLVNTSLKKGRACPRASSSRASPPLRTTLWYSRTPSSSWPCATR